MRVAVCILGDLTVREGEEHVGQQNQRTTREINDKESVNKINEGKQQVSVEDVQCLYLKIDKTRC